MTTTDLEPAAWMYTHQDSGDKYVALNRGPRMYTQYWTETALYTADQLQALIEERDRLRLDLRAQECLQDSAYKAGFKAGWNAGVSEDHERYASAMRSTDHIEELRKIKAERAALAGEKP